MIKSFFSPAHWFALLLVSACLMPALAQAPSEAPLPTIESFQPTRYLGTWYEIAKLPNRFQKQCVANTRATYEVLNENAIRVTNRCDTAEGKTTQAIGEARYVDQVRGKLEVRFAPAWLSWLPMVWGRYWIIDLDPAYDSVLVGEPSREYLWILARSANLPPQRYEALLGRARELGFDVSRVERSIQR